MPLLRGAAGAALLVAPAPTPASGTVSVWVQGSEIGRGTLDSAGEVTVQADTSGLGAGSYQLTIQYGGDQNFAAAETTGSLGVTVAAAEGEASGAGPVAASAQPTATVSNTGLAATGADPWWPLAAAMLLLLGGGALLLAGRLTPRGHH